MRCNREEGRGSKNLKNDGKLGQGVGDLKKGGGLEPPYELWLYTLQGTAAINFSWCKM